MLPLVTREHLSEEDHAHIIQKMVAGSIATRETIIDCLDRNEYNHVTATYFLLAERKLRAQRHDTARKAKADRERKRGEKPAQHLNISPGKVLPGAALDSLLSPNEISQVPQQPPPPQPARVPSIKRNFNRMRQISIVEECEEEKEEDAEEEEDVEVAATMPARGLSRHSSTSSLADKPSGPSCSSPQLHLDLTLAFAAQWLQAEEEGGAVVATPAPFPQSSQIGTGLSRQNSLRRSGESTSGSSPCSERNETPGSPASPTNSSPARWNLQISSLRFVKKDLYNQHFFCVCSNTIWKLRIFHSKVQVLPLFHIWEETCLSTSLSPAWSHCSHPQPNPWGKWGGRQQSRGGQSQARGGSGSWCSRWCCCLAKTWTAT